MIRFFAHISNRIHSYPSIQPRLTLRSFASGPINIAAQNDGRLLIGFTCKVCSTRSHKFMSKKAYNEGVVIIKCDGCKNLHLMADHLQWFDTTKAATGTIEEIMRKKGESVTKLNFDPKEIKSNDPETQKQINQLFQSTTPEDLKEIEQGLLEWLPKK